MIYLNDSFKLALQSKSLNRFISQCILESLSKNEFIIITAFKHCCIKNNSGVLDSEEIIGKKLAILKHYIRLIVLCSITSSNETITTKDILDEYKIYYLRTHHLYLELCHF